MVRRDVIHELKTAAPYWEAVAAGDKTFEVRRDDRGFQRGDKVALVKLNERGSYDTCPYSGGRRKIVRRITYILTGGQLGLEPGYVVLGLSRS